MSQIALYRKYRPQNFDQVIGQSFVVQTLKLSIANANINHAYIFCGTRGTGKTSIAKIFSKAVNCLQPVNGNCCNECANCLAINEGKCMDILELDAASNNGVNEIRSIIDTVNYLPTQLKYKVYIIDEAHMLSTSAWNALLKTIEEPPAHVIFIFATTEFHKIPMTIISRCQRYDFHKLTLSELKTLVTDVCKKEKIKISKEAVNKIALLSDGGARDCLSILNQLATYSSNNITLTAINNVFGLLDIDKKIELINALINKDERFVIEFIDHLKQENLDCLALVTDLTKFLLDKVVFEKTHDENLLKVLTVTDLDKLAVTVDVAFPLVEALNKVYEELKKSSNPQFSLEIYLLKLVLNGWTSTVAAIDQTPTVAKPAVPSTPITPSKPRAKTLAKPVLEEPTPSVEIQPMDLTPPPVFKPMTNTASNNFDLDETFKTVTVTQKYAAVTTSTPVAPVDDFELRFDDKRDSNHLIDKNAKVVNVYLNKAELKQMAAAAKPQVELVPHYDWQQIFNQIAKNHKAKYKEAINARLETLKNMSDFDNELDKCLSEADKILIASANGAILLYDFKNEANKFNSLFWQRSNYDQIRDKLLNGTDNIVYALDKKTAREWTNNFREVKGEDFADVSLDLISTIRSKSDAEVKQDIENILGFIREK